MCIRDRFFLLYRVELSKPVNTTWKSQLPHDGAMGRRAASKAGMSDRADTVSYTHLRAHETRRHL
eukprot:940370-Prorocentrum_lima.AAC.1